MVQRNKLKVFVEPHVIEAFKAVAKGIFPREAYGYLLGQRQKSGRLRVQQLWVPQDLERYARESSVTIPAKWNHQVARYCVKNGYDMLGDIHSHPYTHDRYKHLTTRVYKSKDEVVWPSSVDWMGRMGSNLLTAIMLVYETPNKRLYTRLGMWGPLPEINTNINII